MALTSTERNRRSRRHRAGDHSLCDPARCDDAVASVAPQVTGSRGERLFAELCAARSLGPAERVLAEEAGRLADRLERLHRHLEGRDWLRLSVLDLELSDTVVQVVVRVEKALAETRQQQIALKHLVGELRQSAEPRKPGSGTAPDPMPGGSPGRAAGLGDLIDELAERRGSPAR